MGHSLSDLQYDVQNPNVQPDTGCLSLIFTQLQNTTGCHRQFTGYLLRFAAFPRLPTVLLPDPVNLIVHLVISEPNRYPNFIFLSELRVIVKEQNQTKHVAKTAKQITVIISFNRVVAIIKIAFLIPVDFHFLTSFYIIQIFILLGV